jgi:hypothetical protein
MIRMHIPTQAATPGGEDLIWVSDLEQGLCLQKHQATEGVTFGVTHHSGYAVSLCAYRYQDAKRLQQRLLALPIEWRQPREALLDAHGPDDPQYWILRSILRTWEDIYAVWLDHAEGV